MKRLIFFLILIPIIISAQSLQVLDQTKTATLGKTTDKLSVVGNITQTATSLPTYNIVHTATNSIGRIFFYEGTDLRAFFNERGSTITSPNRLEIGTNYIGGRIILYTGAAQPSVLIDSISNVGIGTTDLDGTPAIGRLTVKGSGNTSATNALVLRDSDETNITTVDNDGNFSTTGTITSDKFAYGSVYIDDTYPDSIDVTSSSAYYTVGAKQGARGKAWTSGGVLKNVTVQDSSMTVGIAGKYEVSYSFSFQTITGVTNGTFNFYLFVNDVKQEKTGAKRLMSGTNDLGVGAVAPTVLSLSANDVIKMKLISPSNNSNTVAFQYAIMHVKRIDN